MSGIDTHGISALLFNSTVELPTLDISYGPIRYYTHINTLCFYHTYLHNCRYLFIVVTRNNNTEPSQIPDSDLVSFHDSSTMMMYVATVIHNISGCGWENMLVLGSRSITELVDTSTNSPTIKRYFNAPLVRGTTYYTFVRAYAYDHNDTVSVVVDLNRINCEHYRTQDMYQVDTHSQLVSTSI